MLLALWLYLATGVALWLMLSGQESQMVRTYRNGEFSALNVVVVSFMAILFWPRLVLAMFIGGK